MLASFSERGKQRIQLEVVGNWVHLFINILVNKGNLKKAEQKIKVNKCGEKNNFIVTHYFDLGKEKRNKSTTYKHSNFWQLL